MHLWVKPSCWKSILRSPPVGSRRNPFTKRPRRENRFGGSTVCKSGSLTEQSQSQATLAYDCHKKRLGLYSFLDIVLHFNLVQSCHIRNASLGALGSACGTTSLHNPVNTRLLKKKYIIVLTVVETVKSVSASGMQPSNVAPSAE